MGQWTVVVQGVGAHHNKEEYDANEIAKIFVAALKQSGHTVTHATFTHSGIDNLDAESK